MAKFVEAKDYTVVYLTTPLTSNGAKAVLEAQQQQQQQQYQYESASLLGDNMQMELKRDTSAHTRRANATQEGGLFERYQYFTPGLFMGFAAVIPLFLILLVGIRALLSLEVSYFAFSKEMGINYPVLVGDMKAMTLAEAAGNRQGALPFTVVIDRNGKITGTKLGRLSRDNLESMFQPLL